MFRLFAIFAISCAIVSCGAKKDIGKLKEFDGPSWVFDAYAINTAKSNDKELAAVGIAEEIGDISVQISQADLKARLELAKQIDSRYSNITKNIIEAYAKSNQKKLSETFSQITVEVVRDVSLRGSYRTNLWQSPAKGTIFSRMAISQKAVDEFLKDYLANYNEKVQDKDFKYVSDKIIERIVGNSDNISLDNSNVAPSSSPKAASAGGASH